ncbi:MAG: NlpC/P60 family protein [Sphingobacteriaceae bacterium]
MDYGICDLAVVTMRADPDHRSEQVSQVLFGEFFTITGLEDKWVKILTFADHYEGWIDEQQFVAMESFVYDQLQEAIIPVTSRPLTLAWKERDKSVFFLPAGSSLPFMQDRKCYIRNDAFEIIGEINEQNTLIQQAKTYLNVPYLWGGRTHFGIDCSGFVQSVFYISQAIRLPRDAWQQAEKGQTINSLTETQPGDLAFFGNEEEKIIHVGILVNQQQIIHASGKVKIDLIDSEGIYSADKKAHTHHLKLIKRITK